MLCEGPAVSYSCVPMVLLYYLYVACRDDNDNMAINDNSLIDIYISVSH